MTEAEWLTATDPQTMLEFLRGKASERKMRLSAVAYCFEVWHLLKDERGRDALHVAEKFADEQATLSEMITSYVNVNSLIDVVHRESRHFKTDVTGFALLTVLSATTTGQCYYGHAWERHPYDINVSVADAVAFSAKSLGVSESGNYLQDIFGNPFRPIALDPTWLTSTVLALSNGIYSEKAFDRMPILADALQDAGCDNEDILNHLRGPGPHAKGCWALDLILDKG